MFLFYKYISILKKEENKIYLSFSPHLRKQDDKILFVVLLESILYS